MSLERKLIASVVLVLMASLLVGALLTYEHAATKVRTEMDAALAVSLRFVRSAVSGSEEPVDLRLRLGRIVAEFNGDRHVRLRLRDGNGSTQLVSVLEPPADPAPTKFFDLLGGPVTTADIELPQSARSLGQLQLETDAHNEVAEAWSDVKLTLIVLFVFFCLVLALMLRALHLALRPIQELCAALTRIGTGDYDTRLAWRNARELAPVQQGFNGMAAQLAEMEEQNRVLRTRMQCVQEDERAELARDLHDDVAPFLFAVSADASLIRQFANNGDSGAIVGRAEGILNSVGHMQKHLREVLCRLMPDVLLDLGLPGAVDALVHFWKTRKPEVIFTVNVSADLVDNKSRAVIFRVVQESLSNAMRHANPSRIDITIASTVDGVDVEVMDDGRGLPARRRLSGLGLLGMRERVGSVGGRFEVTNRADRSGVRVYAALRSARSLAAVG